MSVLIHSVALVNKSSKIADADVSRLASALQKQINTDFAPVWKVHAVVYPYDPQHASHEWPIIIEDDIHQPGALGVHLDEHHQPTALVAATDGWETTVSHEMLEMLADASGNRLHAGISPDGKPCRYLVEVCDPCETVTYSIDGVSVSDFITPAYYTTALSWPKLSRCDAIKKPMTVLPGGYVSWIDQHGVWHQQFVDESGAAQIVTLGWKTTGEHSLREWVDRVTRERRHRERPAPTADELAQEQEAAEAIEQAMNAGPL